MILSVIVFIIIMLSPAKDKYAFATSRKKGKKLTRNNEYEEVIANYITGGN